VRNLSVEWFQGSRNDKDKKLREEMIRASTTMALALHEVLDRWEAELNKSEISKADFDTPNWAFKQAYRNGERARIQKVRDLIAFAKGE
jgi:hypothetical protein